jgi:tRNA pseudouridine55 synthase
MENMEKILNLYKPRGATPLETLEAFAVLHPEYAKEKMTYAGRLDPMAEGVLIALVGEETKNREAYTSLDKEYVFEWIFGLSTDTYDLLGLAEKPSEDFLEPHESAVRKYIDTAKGKIIQRYPPFSSKVVGGKNLFSLAKAGRVRDEDLPTHEVEIKESEYLGQRTLEKADLEGFIRKTISSVTGDFRQKQSLLDWKNRLAASDRETYIIHKARIVVSSGFYVRQFIFDIGKKLSTGAVTFSILRTRVGSYGIDKSLRLQ